MCEHTKHDRISCNKLAKQMGMAPMLLATLIENGTYPFGDVIGTGKRRQIIIFQPRFDAWMRGMDFAKEGQAQ